MPAITVNQPAANSAIGSNGLAAQFARQGWAIQERFLAPATLAELAQTVRKLWEQGVFHPAGIGRGADHQVNTGIRGDRVVWLDGCNAPAITEFVSRQFESLRLALNTATYLGLYEFEGHLAVYPPGAGYRRHLDRFRGSQARVVSIVLYLNEDWREEDGGMLHLFIGNAEQERQVSVTPAGGTLVLFASADIPHEVLPAKRPRFSLTGWFRCRA